ncbi:MULTISPECIES: hypothetical protein [unclassified Neisseria]|nr:MULTISPECIES: hypothetical protein [unclassified Neisseria]
MMKTMSTTPKWLALRMAKTQKHRRLMRFFEREVLRRTSRTAQ